MSLIRFSDVGDTHGDEIDPGFEAAFFDWLADFKPQMRLHGGDIFNLAALRKKASPEEKTIALAPDIEAGKSFAGRYFSGGTRNFLLRGNHDERIYNLARETNDAVLREYSSGLAREIDGAMNRLGVRVLPYDSRIGVLDVDGYRGIHGYASGIGAPRKFASIYGTCVFHHTHSMDVAPFERWPEPSIAYGSGCGCKIDQPYNSTQPGKLRHENGWVYGYTDGTTATYFQARYQHGRVYVAESIKCYGRQELGDAS